MLCKEIKALAKSLRDLSIKQNALIIEQANYCISNNDLIDEKIVQKLLDSFLDSAYTIDDKKITQKFDEVISIWGIINPDSAKFYKEEFYKIKEEND